MQRSDCDSNPLKSLSIMLGNPLWQLQHHKRRHWQEVELQQLDGVFLAASRGTSTPDNKTDLKTVAGWWVYVRVWPLWVCGLVKKITDLSWRASCSGSMFCTWCDSPLKSYFWVSNTQPCRLDRWQGNVYASYHGAQWLHVRWNHVSYDEFNSDQF